MSTSNIIPAGIDPTTKKGREELRGFLKKELQHYDRDEVRVFALRVALRTAWRLERLRIKDKEKLDRFYSFWLRGVTAAAAVSFFKNNKEFSDAAAAYANANAAYAYAAADAYAYADAAFAYAAFAAAYAASAAADAAAAAYAAFAEAAFAAAAAIIPELNHDLSLLNSSKSLKNQSLWSPQNPKKSPPNLSRLNPFWSEFLFTPALQGSLFSEKNQPFFEGFLSIPKEVFKEKSAEAMQISIQEFIESNGNRETTRLARLILLGNGGAGKTSIVNKLCDSDKKLAINEDPTPRIQIRELAVVGKAGKAGKADELETTLNIWDFGGQVIMHSTHSFFLSEESSYIIACNSRANEQPDAWLALLISRLPVSQYQKTITVLVVYTHCDTAQLNGGCKAPWRRDNALRRAFPEVCLDFYNVDLQPGKKGELPGFEALEKTIHKRAIKEGKKPVDSDILGIRDFSKNLESTTTPFMSHKELSEALKKVLGDNLRENISQALRIANSYGYIFPESPVKVGEKITDDDFIWVSQKHWLTFGVYSLINNNQVIKKSGLLDDDDINKALCLGKTRHINHKGEIKPKKSKKYECIHYNEQGKTILKNILLNYRWGLRLNKRLDQLLLPLATTLDEPDELAEIINTFDRAEQQTQLQQPQKLNSLAGSLGNVGDVAMSDSDDDTIILHKPLYIEVALNHQPADFFFKLATYLDSHLSKPSNLWRTGAILDFYGNEQTRAVIQMPDNVLSIRVMGENKENFQQLLLICVRETIDSYKNTRMSAHSYERIWLDDKHSQMLSSELIANLTSGTTIVDKLVKEKLKGAVSMTTINIAGNVSKSNIAGEHNQMTNEGDVYITQVNQQSEELLVQLNALVETLPSTEHEAVEQVNEHIEQLETALAEQDEDNKKSLIRKSLDGLKDIVLIDKGLDLLEEYPAVATVAGSLLQLVTGGSPVM